jgi:putative ABC transport system permease protein
MQYLFSFYADAFKIALSSIFAHKLRAFLTLIGIIIGVASVVVVGASIGGLNSYVITAVSNVLGVNHFMIARTAHQGDISEEERERMNRRNKKLEWEDFEWVQANCATCQEVGAELGTGVTLSQDGLELFGVQLFGATANMAIIEDKKITEGRYFSASEDQRTAHVCVIGMDVKDKFFANVDPIGKTLRVSGLPLTVVGIEDRRGTMFGQSFDRVVYIPLSTFGLLYGRRQSLQIHGNAASSAAFRTAIEDARIALRNKHRLIGSEEDDFGLVNTADLSNQVDSFTGAIAMVVTPVTLISLVVGGIVVMNIMLVSVTERTFEIGLRKAVGATKKQILVQFLIESAFLCALGGILGLVLAAGVSWLISSTTPIPMTITFSYILLSLVVSGTIGIFAGIYPAFKAARLDPIVALTQTT